jgi:hypothetical protein
LISKRDLIARGKQIEESKEQTNLSPTTLESYAKNKRLVDAGLLPEYIGGIAEAPSNPEVERQAERVYKFTHILGNRKSRNEY